MLKIFFMDDGQCDQIWRNFASLANFWQPLENFGLVLGKLLYLFGNFMLLGKFSMIQRSKDKK